MEYKQIDVNDIIGQLNNELEGKLNELIRSLNLQKNFRFSVHTSFIDLCSTEYSLVMSMDVGELGSFDTLQCKIHDSVVCDFSELCEVTSGFARIIAAMKEGGLESEAVSILKRTVKLELYGDILNTYK